MLASGGGLTTREDHPDNANSGGRLQGAVGHLQGVGARETAPKLHLDNLHVQQAAPLQVGGDEGDHLLLGGSHQGEVIGEAHGGDPVASDLNTAPRRLSPAVEGLEEDVQQIGARWAALRQAIGSLPLAAIHLAVAKAATKPLVEGLEDGHQLRSHPGP